MALEDNWAKIIEDIGEDLTRPGLLDTPKRAAKAFQFLTQGYHQSVDDIVNEALFPADSSEMVIVRASGVSALRILVLPLITVLAMVASARLRSIQGARFLIDLEIAE